MKHLYIIGNGFDLFTGLQTRYSDFRGWLAINYDFVYECLGLVYRIDGEWWNDFETQLGQLDVKSYVKMFQPSKINKDAISKINSREQQLSKTDGLPHFRTHSYCAAHLRGLLEILQFCFERWIHDCQRSISNVKYVSIEKTDSLFLNFNYTDVLESLYEIPEDRVLHIHGRASKHDRLIFGHNRSHMSLITDESDYDSEQACFELGKYQKNPYQYLFQQEKLMEKISDVREVHVYGFSLSPVDEDYLDWIGKHTKEGCKWEFSWYTEQDKRRIEKFLLDHWRIKANHRLIKLDAIQIKNEVREERR